MATQTIDLGNTDSVTYDGSEVCEIKLDGASIWTGCSSSVTITLVNGLSAADPIEVLAGKWNAGSCALTAGCSVVGFWGTKAEITTPPGLPQAYGTIPSTVLIEDGGVDVTTSATVTVQGKAVGSSSWTTIALSSWTAYSSTAGCRYVEAGAMQGNAPTGPCIVSAFGTAKAVGYSAGFPMLGTANGVAGEEYRVTYSYGGVSAIHYIEVVPAAGSGGGGGGGTPATPAFGPNYYPALVGLGLPAPGPLQVGGYLPGVESYGLKGGSDIMPDGSPKETWFMISGEVNRSNVLSQGTSGAGACVLQTGVVVTESQDREWHNLTTAGIYDSPNKINYQITKVGSCSEPAPYVPPGHFCQGYFWTGAAANPGFGGDVSNRYFSVEPITDQFLPGGTRWEVRVGGILKVTATFFYPGFFGGSSVTHTGNVRSVTPLGVVTDSLYTFHFGASASPHGITWNATVDGGASQTFVMTPTPGGTWGTSLYPVGSTLQNGTCTRIV